MNRTRKGAYHVILTSSIGLSLIFWSPQIVPHVAGSACSPHCPPSETRGQAACGPPSALVAFGGLTSLTDIDNRIAPSPAAGVVRLACFYAISCWSALYLFTVVHARYRPVGACARHPALPKLTRLTLV